MFTRRQFVRSAVAASAAAPAFSIPSFGQDHYPSGVIKAICMFGPGSGADTKVRFYANKLAELVGRPVIVENRPGVSGNIASEAVARSKPDGYTIYIAPGSSTLAAAPALFKHLAYDPINDFEHITTLSESAFVLCVPGDSPIKTISDLTAHLKDKGDKASYGTVANPGMVAIEIYKRAFGLPTVEVNYKDMGGMLNDASGGNIAFFSIDITSMIGHFKSGRFRPLCVTSAKKLDSIPSIPGAAEAGIPNLNVTTWWSVHVAAKTPKDICDKLETWFNKIAVEPDAVKFNADIGSDVLAGNSESLKALLVSHTKAWAEYVRLAKIDPV